MPVTKKTESAPSDATTTSATITNAQYRRAVMKTLADPKLSKTGLRNMMRKRKNVILSHALSGISTEVGETLDSMAAYIAGHQLNDSMRQAFADESGDLWYYTHLAAKQVGAKMPAATKKIKPKHTPVELLMQLNSFGFQLASINKKLFYGQELDVEKVKGLLEGMAPVLTELTWSLLDKAPAYTMTGNVAKLAKRYPSGQFSVEDLTASKASKAESATAA